MSDNPYERDNPDETLELDPSAPGPDVDDDALGGPADAPATEQVPTATPPSAASPAAPAEPREPVEPVEPAEAEPLDAGSTGTAPPAPSGPGESPLAGEPTDPYATGPATPQEEDATAAEPDQHATTTGPIDGHALTDEPATTRISTTDPDGAVTSTYDVREAERTRPSGTHQADRPVPRSGLAEHNSAGYLTGDRLPLQQDADLTAPTESDPATTDGSSAAWLAGGATGATAAGAGAAAPTTATSPDRPRTDRDVVLDGTTALTRPPSRAAAHVWAVVVTLVLTPVAWYLLADAGARLTLPQANPWETGNLNVAALLELGGGLLVLAVVLLAARWSSLGAIITGALVLVVGVPFVAVPAWTQEILEPVTEWLNELGDFGGNVAHHLVATGSTGRFVVYGLALILIGVVSHGARRQGRREVRPVVGTD